MINQLVSVIIPAYNCAPFLPDAIQSALNQHYPYVEVVVVNDGSPDNTDEVVQPYLDRIVYIKQENKGLSGARNAGFRASHGDLVCFLDADDTLLLDKFDKQLTVFEREQDLGVVISGYLDIDADGQTIINTVYKHWHRDALDHLLNHIVFPVHAALIRRSVLDSQNPFPEVINRGEYQEDWQLWLDLALKGVQFSSVPEPTCRYWRRAGSGSSFPLKHLDGARRVVNWLRQHPQAGPYQLRIERLGAIVEMERVARAWQVGLKEESAKALLTSIQQTPDFWFEPNTYLLLFERSLDIKEVVSWKVTRETETIKKRLFSEIIASIEKKLTFQTSHRVCAAVWLMLSDEAYGNKNTAARRVAVKHAWQSSKEECLSKQGRTVFIRGIFGPNIIALVRGNWRKH